MRWTNFLLSLLLTAGFLVLLLVPVGPATFPLGSFLDPFQGFWQNAFSGEEKPDPVIPLSGLSGKVEVVIDERDVPHIFADKLTDAAYVQGYLTAKDRLWQMDFQIRAAAGRLSELIGVGPDSAVLNLDRIARRKGIPWAAENTIRMIREQDPEVYALLEAYSNGINAWIDQMSPADWPLEFKILHYRPEAWSPYKSALLMKYMADMLAAGANDLEYSYAMELFGRTYFDLLYPEYPYAPDPIVPAGTLWPADSTMPAPPAAPASYLPEGLAGVSQPFGRTPEGIGSNNWAVAGSKTATGKPLLANDPHLGLNLPSIWYETQVVVPGMNCYGVTLPGAPGIVIGYNDSIAWGVTNGSQDVMDFYTIEYQDATQKAYRYADGWKQVEIRVDTYFVKGGAPMLDSVRYTDIGPVMYDQAFGDTDKPLALRWMAHESGNEIRTFLELMRSRNYEDYAAALTHFVCPAQNFVFASAAGDIALWQQGKNPLRWKEQGRFVLDGSNPAHRWQGFIPQPHNPHVVNPAQGFVGSANQHPTGPEYPYYYTGGYDGSRGRRLFELLRQTDSATVEDMMAIQQDALSTYARDILPLMLAELDTTVFEDYSWSAYRALKSWDYRYDREKEAATLFHFWWESLMTAIWQDECEQEVPIDWPSWATTVRILRDSTEFKFYQKTGSSVHYDRRRLVNETFDKLVGELSGDFPTQSDWNWGDRKGTHVRHLARVLAPFNRMVVTDGVRHVLNATDRTHGPSWRMVVSLGDKPTGYGIYPGGQVGHPGHPRYDAFLDKWSVGEYYQLWRMTSAGDRTGNVRAAMTFQPST